ncbi:MAG TPA: hypothetical protein VGG08_04585 [Solirubrobacteraceae bacterium]
MSTPSTAVDRPADAEVERAIAIAEVASPQPLASLPNEQEINSLWRLAVAYHKSGIYKDLKQAEQAFAKMLAGRDLGLAPTQAMQGLYFVEGRLQAAAPMMGHFVRSKEGYDFDVTEITDEGCTIVFTLPNGKTKESSFTQDDADKAKLAGKDTYSKYPRNMFFSRAMSNGVKWFVPEAMGGMPVYVEGELGAGSARDGEVGGAAALPPATDAELEKAVRDYLPEAHVDEALALMREMNGVASNSWTTAKVQMVFSGKEGDRAIRREFEMMRRSIDEIAERRRVTGDPVPAADAEAESEDVVDAVVVVPEAGGEDAAPVAAAAADAPSEDELKEAERVRVRRVEHLEQSLENPEVNEQQRSDIEAELDLLTSDPPDAAAGEDDIQF